MALAEQFMWKFDREGTHITDERWIELQKNRDYRFVLTTRIGDLACVITIWDGYDPYRLSDSEEPHLIFETTVFRPSTDGKGFKIESHEDLRWAADSNIDQPRHASEEAARAWHHSIAEKIQRRQL